MVYKDNMDFTDVKDVERLVSSGVGFWESDEKDEEYYIFPCLAQLI